MPLQNLLLIDSGATHTRAMITSVNGMKLGEGRGGPSNIFATGEKTAVQNLARAVNEALAASRLRKSAIAVAIAGSASIDLDGEGGSSLSEALRARLAKARVRVVSDALIALEGALPGKPGVVVASGTGSIVLGRSPQGETLRTGGWGPLLGDEGSAQWVGQQALRAAARAVDGSGPATLLTSALSRAFGLRSFNRIIDVVYRQPMKPAELGALAPLVTRAARRGDACALEIFRRAGEELAKQAAAAARRLRLKHPAVSYQGSMFRCGRLILDPFAKGLHHLLPSATIAPPLLPPLGGAYLLALAELRVKVTPAHLAAFRRYHRA